MTLADPRRWRLFLLAVARGDRAAQLILAAGSGFSVAELRAAVRV